MLGLVRPFFEQRGEPFAFVGRHFATLGVQAGFSNHQHPEPALGRLDVIDVSGTTADAVFAGCADRTIGAVQAFARDRERYSDLADLQFLLSLPDLDQAQARSYFESAGLSDYYEQLRRR